MDRKNSQLDINSVSGVLSDESVSTFIPNAIETLAKSGKLHASITNVIDDVGEKQGSVPSGGLTDDTLPLLQGEATPESYIVIYLYNYPIGYTYADAKGNWEYQITNKLSDGEKLFHIEASLGSEIPVKSDSYSINIGPDPEPTLTLEIIDDVGPVTGNIASGDNTDDLKPVFKGEGVTGETVIISNNGNYLGEAVVGPNGKWQFEPDNNLEEGSYQITAVSMSNDTPPVETGSAGPVDFSIAVSPDAVDDISPIVYATYSKTLFSSDFEIGNGEINSKGLYLKSIDGWDHKGKNYIEITDQFGGADGSDYAVQLNRDSSKSLPSARFLVREVETQDGAIYDLNFKYAGQPGVASKSNKFGLYINGVNVQQYQSKGGSKITWKDGSYQFEGDGSVVRIEFRENGKDLKGGKGALLDNISLTESHECGCYKDMHEDSTVLINVLANDSDPHGQELRIKSVDSEVYVEGVLVGHASVVKKDGQQLVKFEPNTELQRLKSGESVTVEFNYTVVDPDSYTDTAKVSIKVYGDNDAPEANHDFVTVTSSESVIVDVLANDTDLEGDSLKVTQVNGVNLKQGKAVTVQIKQGTELIKAKVTLLKDGQLKIVPTLATDTQDLIFDYTVSDGQAESSAVISVRLQQPVTADIIAISDDTGLADFITSDLDGITVEGELSRALQSGEILEISLNDQDWTAVAVASNTTQWSFDDTSHRQSGDQVNYQVRIKTDGVATITDEQLVAFDAENSDAEVKIISITEDTGVADFRTADLDGLIVSGIVEGALNDDERVEISLDGLNWFAVDVVDGEWSYEDAAHRTNGKQVTYQIRIIDIADNVGSTDSQLVIFDTQAPQPGVNISSITEDTGAADFRTADLDGITVSGTVGALAIDEKVQISLNGTDWFDVNSNNGSWSYDDANTRNEGDSVTYQVQVIDGAGNVGSTDEQLVEFIAEPVAKLEEVHGNQTSMKEGNSVIYTFRFDKITTEETAVKIDLSQSGVSASLSDLSSIRYSVAGDDWYTLNLKNGIGTITVPEGTYRFKVTATAKKDTLFESTETMDIEAWTVNDGQDDLVRDVTNITDTSVTDFRVAAARGGVGWHGSGDKHITNPTVHSLYGLPNGTEIKWYVDGRYIGHQYYNGRSSYSSSTGQGGNGTWPGHESDKYNLGSNDYYLRDGGKVWATATYQGVTQFIGDITFNWPYNTPLILDMNDDGVGTISEDKATLFDIDADGDLEQTGWVDSNDALLVHDINGDGQINDASELFGDSTQLEDGSEAGDGFAALADLDSNGDGVFDQLDDAYSQLAVWQDRNGDGVVQEGEMLALEEAGVASIDLQAQVTEEFNNGNRIGLKGSWTDDEGNQHELADVWFAKNEGSYQDSGGYLAGDALDNDLVGGAGDDILIGGAGDDILTGGAGRDLFVWNADSISSDGEQYADTVKDFNLSKDALNLSDLISSDEETDVIGQYIAVSENNAGHAVISVTGEDGAVSQIITLENVTVDALQQNNLLSTLQEEGTLNI